MPPLLPSVCVRRRTPVGAHLGVSRVVSPPCRRPKVGNLDPIVVRHQEVLRLEVPVDDAVLH